MTADSGAKNRKFWLEVVLQFCALLSCIVCFARTYAGEKIVKEQRDSWQRRMAGYSVAVCVEKRIQPIAVFSDKAQNQCKRNICEF